MESLNEELARTTVKWYVCSNCWGELKLHPDLRENRKYFVLCQKCWDETKGYVTQYFANRRRNESEFERRDVVRLLRKLEILPSLPKMTDGERSAIFGYPDIDTTARTKKADFQFDRTGE